MTKVDSGWLVNAPILVMDDESFLDYCKQIGFLNTVFAFYGIFSTEQLFDLILQCVQFF